MFLVDYTRLTLVRKGNPLLSCFPVRDGPFLVIPHGKPPPRAGPGAGPGLAPPFHYASWMRVRFGTAPAAF